MSRGLLYCNQPLTTSKSKLWIVICLHSWSMDYDIFTRIAKSGQEKINKSLWYWYCKYGIVMHKCINDDFHCNIDEDDHYTHLQRKQWKKMIMDSSLSRGNFVILTPLTNWEQTGSAAAKNSRFTIYIMIIMMVTIISTSFQSCCLSFVQRERESPIGSPTFWSAE